MLSFSSSSSSSLRVNSRNSRIAAAQLPLPRFKAPRYEHPLAAIETAKALLDLTEDEIRALVDEGGLVAFDIRHPDAERPELRILTESIQEFTQNNLEGLSDCYHSMIAPYYAVHRVMDALHHLKPIVTGKELKALLNCGRVHLINLVDAKAIPQLPGTNYRPGPGGWPVIARDTVEAFLKQRIVGGPLP